MAGAFPGALRNFCQALPSHLALGTDTILILPAAARIGIQLAGLVPGRTAASTERSRKIALAWPHAICLPA